MAAEAEAVGQGRSDIELAGLIWYVVKIAVWIGCFIVDGGRHDPVAYGQALEEIRAATKRPYGELTPHLDEKAKALEEAFEAQGMPVQVVFRPKSPFRAHEKVQGELAAAEREGRAPKYSRIRDLDDLQALTVIFEGPAADANIWAGASVVAGSPDAPGVLGTYKAPKPGDDNPDAKPGGGNIHVLALDADDLTYEVQLQTRPVFTKLAFGNRYGGGPHHDETEQQQETHRHHQHGVQRQP